MELKKFNIGADEVEFANEYQNCRDGFNHRSVLFINRHFIAETKVHYINRTWERYHFQTSMLKAVRIAMEVREERIKDNYRWTNNISRIVGKRKEEVQAIIDNDDEIVVLKKIIEELR